MTKTTKIMIVDDSVTARMCIRRCLEIIGYNNAEFLEATNGRDALTKAKTAGIDLLLTDLNMPVMDGETLVKWVKSSPKLTDIPVIVITSAGNPAKENILLGLGVQAVINKPVTPGGLQQVLPEQVTEEWSV
ncbi:MAG: response regulator [Thermodesulfobacteriota bacterium]|nr:response regulator [Thermodesulfobacteriota bacterium]